MSAPGERRFRYRAVARDGRVVSDVVGGASEAAVLRVLAAEGLTVTRLSPVAPGGARTADRDLRLAERVLLLRQLGLMLKAGVPLLEAMETAALGIEASRGARQFAAVIQALRHGEPFAQALETHAPGFPRYVYAMARIGEASGRIAQVLSDAADQMADEDRLRRDIVNALTYPAFLACAGVAAVGFIFVEIVPRFATMLDPSAGRMPLISRLVLDLGMFVNAHALWLGLLLAGLVTAGVAVFGRPAGRAQLYDLARRTPLLGALLREREIGLWARLMAFGLAQDAPLLSTAALARTSVPPGPFHEGLRAFEGELRSGVAVADGLARHTRLTPMDLSLVRAGQRSGSLPAMFAHMAASYEDRVRDGVKRMTALVEPLAIAAIAVLVGIIALALVMALASVYETVY